VKEHTFDVLDPEALHYALRENSRRKRSSKDVLELLIQTPDSELGKTKIFTLEQPCVHHRRFLT
jgi:hypothetical protein